MNVSNAVATVADEISRNNIMPDNGHTKCADNGHTKWSDNGRTKWADNGHTKWADNGNTRGDGTFGLRSLKKRFETDFL